METDIICQLASRDSIENPKGERKNMHGNQIITYITINLFALNTH
ncbi:hypothetical protein PROVALCAL_00627 [Providencia alcalifaciens DSM 30120]|uniref:Uncharacterized protein n=1 Tax=Providencia alcalifaciens DSM 30120 TaxID=520999 RepID=B6XBD0_9GAMM|nr:hypothetical protein PROVALCAL_00627 [Providencia alcalifaciens DSM 30120]